LAFFGLFVLQNDIIVRFIHELGHLKKIENEGLRIHGVLQPESVAEHNLRAAQIAFIIAELEGHPDPAKVATMMVFHEIAESRIGDLHLMARKYSKFDEERVVKDQVAGLGEIGQDILGMWQEVERTHTLAGVIAKDADYLEHAVTAKEFVETGFPTAEAYFYNVERAMKTESAKKLFKAFMQRSSHEWHKPLDIRKL